MEYEKVGPMLIFCQLFRSYEVVDELGWIEMFLNV